MVQPLHSINDRSLQRLVDLERGLVSREVYVNPDIYQQELEQVFGRAWLLVGHESLVPNPGDFFQSRMGAESVKDLVSRLDLAEVEADLKETIATAKGQRKAKSIKRHFSRTTSPISASSFEPIR